MIKGWTNLPDTISPKNQRTVFAINSSGTFDQFYSTPVNGAGNWFYPYSLAFYRQLSPGSNPFSVGGYNFVNSPGGYDVIVGLMGPEHWKSYMNKNQEIHLQPGIIYPNPGNGRISIRSGTTAYCTAVRNAWGQRVHFKTIDGGLDISDLQDQMYYLEFTHPDGTHSYIRYIKSSN